MQITLPEKHYSSIQTTTEVYRKSVESIQKTIAQGELQLFKCSQTTANRTISDSTITRLECQHSIAQVQVLLGTKKVDEEISLILREIADHEINLDSISICSSQLAFSTDEQFSDRVCKKLEKLGYICKLTPKCAKISVKCERGNDIQNLIGEIFGALAERNIPVLYSSGYSTSLSLLLKESDLEMTAAALYRKFALTSGEQIIT